MLGGAGGGEEGGRKGEKREGGRKGGEEGRGREERKKRGEKRRGEELRRVKRRGESSLVPRPHPLTRRNGLVNQVDFLGLAHAFATM